MEDIDLRWRTSSYSGNGGGNCVEVGSHGGMILVRDTKQGGQGPVCRYAVGQWRAFLAGVRNGQFNLDEQLQLS
jgi:Domain of unknown function (DUF397)